MERKLEYINQGRGGYVIYKDNDPEIKLYFEYGGGDCVAIIYIPTAESWTKETKRSIATRLSIINFIAEQSVKDQAPGCRYEISGSCIEIFRNK